MYEVIHMDVTTGPGGAFKRVIVNPGDFDKFSFRLPLANGTTLKV